MHKIKNNNACVVKLSTLKDGEFFHRTIPGAALCMKFDKNSFINLGSEDVEIFELCDILKQ